MSCHFETKTFQGGIFLISHMEELSLEKKKKALIIVAHPDDETIWMGGVLLRYKNISWTILSLCRRFDPDRKPKFLKVMKFFGARGIISDLEDDGKLTLKQTLPKIKKRILKNLKLNTFNYIFTHGENGEYGHDRHIGTHQIVKKMVEKGELLTDNLFFFAYRADAEKKICKNAKADFFLKLKQKEFRIKRNIIKNLYGFSKFSPENCVYSLKIETFTKFKKKK